MRTYLNSSFLMYSMMMSLSGWICSSLSVRHMNSQGLRAPPNVPPAALRPTACKQHHLPAESTGVDAQRQEAVQLSCRHVRVCN
jgi:hypothetical protein